jgi:hypothetical protein
VDLAVEVGVVILISVNTGRAVLWGNTMGKPSGPY